MPFFKKNTSDHYSKKTKNHRADANNSSSQADGGDAVNVLGDLLASNDISSYVFGVFNTEGGTAAVMTDLSVLCECDRFGGDQCESCVSRLCIMESGPGDGLYAVHVLTHPGYQAPIGLFSIFDEELSGASVNRILNHEEGELLREEFATDREQFLIATALSCYRWNTLKVDTALYVADSTAIYDEQTAILFFDVYPGLYEVAAICLESPDEIPFGFLAIHSDFAPLFDGLFLDLGQTKSELLAKTSGRMVTSHGTSVVEQAYALNRIISMRAGDIDDAVSWLMCGVLDGYKESIEIANGMELNVDDEYLPMHMRRLFGRTLLRRGRLTKASELFTSIIHSAPEANPDEEVQRQASLNDFIFSGLIPSGRIDEAIEVVNYALSEDTPMTSEKVNAKSNLAQLYYIKGDFDQCRNAAQSVLDHIAARDFPVDPYLDLTGEANFWKGMSLVALGDVDGGRECLSISANSSDMDYVGRARRELANSL